MNSAVGSSFVYVTYIRATPERVWSALVWSSRSTNVPTLVPYYDLLPLYTQVRSFAR